jgi:short-subunit dehydrogenase
MELRGKTVLITGASRGIGAEMAKQFAAKGYTVILVARSLPELESLAKEIGGHAYVVDLLDYQQIKEFSRQIHLIFGGIDVLVNNAGVDSTGDFLTTDSDVLRDTVALNLGATIQMCRYFLPEMVQRGSGHVVNVTSVAGVAAFSGMAVYAATKAGISQFTAALRAELNGCNVQTTLVEISAVNTTMAISVMDYPPTGAAANRLRRFGLLKFLDPVRVAFWTVHAVENHRRHVRLPYRAWLLYAIAEIPRRMTEWLVIGVKSRPESYVNEP